MIGNVIRERMAVLAPNNFETAVQTWEALHAVELSLGGDNENSGGVWILCINFADLLYQSFGKIVVGLGLFTGLGRLLTVLPPLGEVASPA